MCPSLDIASQGKSIEDAKSNIKKLKNCFFEYSDNNEISNRINKEYYLSSLEVDVA